ncbi:hypothetical protein F0562_015369 [Nyssa sinensis]|uniref:Disease resistance protein At4g27190-like leucine-rich repeats domain-containing protein n=1 Tax=Nyssa sinensis TaxID=561372 RepID=A0A5J4ZH40_9ASTE|nr:hypothetical protein F0562_015369 [Nyssa sinensis]
MGRCEMTSEIVTGDNRLGENAVDIIEFPQLSFLRLNNLPNLASFFPKVVHMASECPRNDNLKEIDGGSGEILTDDNLHTPMQPLFNDKVAYPSLEILEHCQLSNINEIWGRQLPSGFCKLRLTALQSKSLVNLQKLKIDDCLIMEEVVGWEEGEEQEKSFFPQLSQLELMNLPKLRSFLHVIYALEWPLLESVAVYDCPELKTLSVGSLSTPKLKGVKVATKEPLAWMGDLNNTIQHLDKGKMK